MHARPVRLTFEQRSASQGAALEEVRGPIKLKRPATPAPSRRLGRLDQHVNRVARFGAPVLVLGISVKQYQPAQHSEMLHFCTELSSGSLAPSGCVVLEKI